MIDRFVGLLIWLAAVLVSQPSLAVEAQPRWILLVDQSSLQGAFHREAVPQRVLATMPHGRAVIGRTEVAGRATLMISISGPVGLGWLGAGA
jgi:hypothetical protein